MKLNSFAYLIREGMGNIRKNKVMVFASFCVMMVSLLLVGFSVLFTINVNLIVGNIENKNEIIVYLNDGLTDESIKAIGEDLKNIENITEVNFYSKDEAYADFTENMAGYEEYFKVIDESPLPDSYRVKVADTERMANTVTVIKNIYGVDDLSAPMDFANILTELKRTISLVSAIVIVALVIVSIIIISNSTRASVFSRRKEINIMKYVGATNAFIRIPFFVEGMFTGFLAGIFALVITWLSYNSMLNILTRDTSLFLVLNLGSLVPFKSVALQTGISYVVAGSLLGSLGSVISTRKHLKV